MGKAISGGDAVMLADIFDPSTRPADPRGGQRGGAASSWWHRRRPMRPASR
jgi:hypothetical protein